MCVLATLTLLAAIAVTCMVVLLNVVDAAPGIAVAALGALAVGTGLAIGRNAERLPHVHELAGGRRPR